MGGVTPPIISTSGPSYNLMGISRSRSGPVCIEFGPGKTSEFSCISMRERFNRSNRPGGCYYEQW